MQKARLTLGCIHSLMCLDSEVKMRSHAFSFDRDVGSWGPTCPVGNLHRGEVIVAGGSLHTRRTM